jgi:uncharacterized repeat protein (TIGR03803 family)
MALTCLQIDTAAAAVPKILHSFCSRTSCTDGQLPLSALLRDTDGTLYGTTLQGGTHNAGVVFALVPNGSGFDFKVLHSFCGATNCADGSSPLGKLIVDVNGNLYGTASAGGAHSNGMVFELIPDATKTTWKRVTLYNFCPLSGCPDGQQPGNGLTYSGADTGAPFDGTSPLFGTAARGGGTNAGVAFKLTEVSGKVLRQEKVIHSFCSRTNCRDGGGPSGLTVDGNGNLYGAGTFGGQNSDGVLFRLSAANNFAETVLYDFCSLADCADGQAPTAQPVLDANGRLFGTTNSGGAHGQGTVYRLGTNGVETVLYSFCAVSGCTDGAEPQQPVALDSHGHVFGVTPLGGTNGFGNGTVFELQGTTFSLLYSFCAQPSCTDGSQPGGFILTGTDVIFGVTGGGGAHGAGTVYRFTP